MLLTNIIPVLLSIFDQCPVRSLMVFPTKFSKLLCKGTCKWYGGCTRVDYMNKNFQCELVHGAEVRIQIFQVQCEHPSYNRRKMEREVYATHGLPLCLKVTRRGLEVPITNAMKRRTSVAGGFIKNRGNNKLSRCAPLNDGVTSKRSTVVCDQREGNWTQEGLPCDAPGSKEKDEENDTKRSATRGELDPDDKNCILYKQTNLTYRMKQEMLGLPIKVLPGMKLTVRGSYVEDLRTSQCSIPRNPKNVKAVWDYIHTIAEWDKKKLGVTEVFSEYVYNGTFPISDPANFSITFALTQSDIKVYADNVLVTSKKSVPYVQEYIIRRYSSVYLVVVEKNEGVCSMPGSE